MYIYKVYMVFLAGKSPRIYSQNWRIYQVLLTLDILHTDILSRLSTSLFRLQRVSQKKELHIGRFGQNHIYGTVYLRYFWQGHHHTSRFFTMHICMVLANAYICIYIRFWPILHISTQCITATVKTCTWITTPSVPHRTRVSQGCNTVQFLTVHHRPSCQQLH